MLNYSLTGPMAHKDVLTQVMIDQDMVEGAHPFSSQLDSLKQNGNKEVNYRI